MRKSRDGEKKKTGGKKGEKTDDYSGHYVIASSWPPERWPLERRPLVPIDLKDSIIEEVNLMDTQGKKRIKKEVTNLRDAIIDDVKDE